MRVCIRHEAVEDMAQMWNYSEHQSVLAGLEGM